MLNGLMRKLLNHINLNLLTVLRFALVGMFGTVINFAIYSSVMKFTTLGINVSAIAAFFVAVINNYIINHKWTFAAENYCNPINRAQFTYYVLGNLIGLFTNLLTLNIFVATFGMKFHIIGQLLGILFGMIFNFYFVKKIVFTNALRVPRKDSDS
jgi:putative flippase GtrA